MARKGVAILREIALVKASDTAPAVKVAMLKELNDELAALYAPREDTQGKLDLQPADVQSPGAARVLKKA